MDLTRLGKYEIVGKIGQGAMGEVYRAHDAILNRDVAVKTMSAAIGSDDELRKRFHREAQSAARLNHPNIITVYDFGEEGGKIYMAMELLEGRDLKDVIGRHTPLTLDQKVQLMEQITEGLAFAHAKEVVHRDLKPANIHIQPNGQVKIMDFGLAKLASSDMTRAGMIMGTPNYMSPEQVRGEKADARSDVFSLGAVFYELLANRKPFEADSLHAVLFQVMQNEPEPLLNLVPDVPPLLAQVVERAMAKDSTQRFRDAGELRDAMRQVRSQMSTGWTMTPQPAPGGDVSDATVVGSFSPVTSPASRPPQSWPPPSAPGSGSWPGSPAPQSWPPTPGAPASWPPAAQPPTMATPSSLPGAARSQPPVSHPPTPVPGSFEGEKTTLQPPPPRMTSQPDPEVTTVQPRSALPVARPVPPPSMPPVSSRAAEAAPEREPEPSRPPTPTLSGSVPTQVPSTASSPVPSPPTSTPPPIPRPRPAVTPPPPSEPRPSRPGAAKSGPPIVLIAGGGVLLLILAVGLYFVLSPGKGPEPEPESSPSASPSGGTDTALLAQLLDSRADLARRDVEDKNYRAALEKTHEVLGKDPNHALAKKLQDQAEKALQDIDTLVAATRKSIDSGDVKGASEGLTKLFALDPKNPAAAEFSTRLNQFFRGQAEAAKKDMADSQRRAERVRGNAQSEYAAANAISREAEGLFARSEFAQATRKYSEARDAFDSARRAAEHAVRTPTPTLPTPTPTAVAVITPTPAPTPPPTPVATPEAPTAGEDRAVREVVSVYARAIGTRNVELLKTVKPDLSGKEQDALKRAPQAEVTMNVLSVATQGDKSTVMVSRNDKLAENGKVFAFQQTLLLVKKDGRWVIQRIAIQQIP